MLSTMLPPRVAQAGAVPPRLPPAAHWLDKEISHESTYSTGHHSSSDRARRSTPPGRHRRPRGSRLLRHRGAWAVALTTPLAALANSLLKKGSGTLRAAQFPGFSRALRVPDTFFNRLPAFRIAGGSSAALRRPVSPASSCVAPDESGSRGDPGQQDETEVPRA
jgi:hypothetical protein